MSTTSNLSLDELNCIMNLQRQEAFDLSGSERRRQNELKAEEERAKFSNPEDVLMKIVNEDVPRPLHGSSGAGSGSGLKRRPSSRPRGSGGGGISRNHSDPHSIESGGHAQQQQHHDNKPPRRVSDVAGRSSASTGSGGSAGKRPSYARSQSSRRGLVTKSKAHNDMHNGTANKEVTTIGGRTSREASRRSSSNGRARSRSNSQKPRRNRSESASTENFHASMPVLDHRGSETRRNSSVSRRDSMKRSRSRPSLRDSKNEPSSNDLRGKSRRELLQKEHSKKSLEEEEKRPETKAPPVATNPTAEFDKLWGDEIFTGTNFTNYIDTEGPLADEHKASDATSTVSEEKSLTSDGVRRKTKLEKIHELQAKCDRYKQEWINVSKEQKTCKKELQLQKLQVISLAKEIDTHVSETGILRKNLADTLKRLDDTQEEQRRERNEYSGTAKELAQSRIDYAKSLNETRELRTELDQLQSTIKEKDQKIEKLLDDLDDADQKMDDLKADVKFAEKEILKLEDKIHDMEEELIMYRSAADKDDEDERGENIRKVRDDMEMKLHEERERRLEEKQKKLEEKIQNFEEEKLKHEEKLKEKERELEEHQQQASDQQRERDEERHRLDDEINQRLKHLEDNNTVLQGRLKSEQLDTNVKLKKKDESIEALRKELSEVRDQLEKLNSDPNGVTSLQNEIELVKAESAATADELQDAQKRNGMLEEEIEELQNGNAELRAEIDELRKQVAELQGAVDQYRAKAEEWRSKSSEWTEKAFLYKERADKWEKIAKDSNPDASSQSTAGSATPAEPQALFLQAAWEKKQSANAAAAGAGWGRLGGLFSKMSEDDSETQNRLQELETQNAKQLETIKNLRSEMVKMQTMYKEKAYADQQQMKKLHEEKDAIALRNTTLQKELDLARKLESFADRDF